jgi:hypothetical protein
LSIGHLVEKKQAASEVQMPLPGSG